MADPAGAGPVHVLADLDVAVTLPDGRRSSVAVTGDGTGELHVVLEHPQVASAGMGRRDLGRAAEALAAVGLSARVSGPHGLIARAGSGVSSRTGTVLTGSPRVALTVHRDGLSAMRGMLPRVAELSLATVVVGVVLWVVASRVPS